MLSGQCVSECVCVCMCGQRKKQVYSEVNVLLKGHCSREDREPPVFGYPPLFFGVIPHSGIPVLL